ncbi:putative complex I intermediate-associated protein 30, mitochondrial [Trichinella pseudospiralis]|nr:putative complex I intermediate-associated protein 30, mitochondrial [Trichinella pseudospiralis]
MSTSPRSNRQAHHQVHYAKQMSQLTSIFRIHFASKAKFFSSPNKLHSGRPSTTLWMPTERGYDFQEPDIPLKELFKQIPQELARQAKLISKEIKDWAWPEKTIIESTPLHNQLYIQWKFDSQEVLDSFTVTSDRAQNVGFSQATWTMSDQGTAVFQGSLDTRVPKDGEIHRAGFTAIISKLLMKSFNRQEVYEHWSLFTHLVLKIRGDGRTYLLNLSQPGYFDVQAHDIFNYPLYTHGGPYWQYEKIPFSKFYLSSHARIQDQQVPVLGYKSRAWKGNGIKRFGVTLCDRTDGPFRLEIDWIVDHRSYPELYHAGSLHERLSSIMDKTCVGGEDKNENCRSLLTKHIKSDDIKLTEANSKDVLMSANCEQFHSETDTNSSPFPSNSAKASSSTAVDPLSIPTIRPLATYEYGCPGFKHDPVSRYNLYAEEWKKFPPPGEKKHLTLRWKIREKMSKCDFP